MRIHLEFFDKYIMAVQDLISIMHEFKIIKWMKEIFNGFIDIFVAI